MPDIVSERIERLMNEGLLGPAALARHLGTFRGGRPTHPSSVSRAMLQGTRLPDGRVVRLEHVKINGRMMSSRAALVRYLAAQQVDDEQPEQDPAPRTPTARRKASEEAVRELEKLGA